MQIATIVLLSVNNGARLPGTETYKVQTPEQPFLVCYHPYNYYLREIQTRLYHAFQVQVNFACHQNNYLSHLGFDTPNQRLSTAN